MRRYIRRIVKKAETSLASLTRNNFIYIGKSTFYDNRAKHTTNTAGNTSLQAAH